MTDDQIQAWAREADGYANAYGQYHAWDSTFDKQAVRDAHFARLVRAAAWEEAAKVCNEEHRRDDLTGDYRYGAGICEHRIRALAAAEKEPSKDPAHAEIPAGDYSEIMSDDQNASSTYNLSVAEQRAFGRALRRSTKRIDNLDAVLANARRYQWLRDNGEYDIAQIADDGYTEYRVIFWSASMTLDEAVDAKLSKVNDE